jgi:predicted site-specific integrase-resolvase
MSPTPKTAKKPTKQSAHARCAENDRLASRITKSLEVAQADLEKLSGSVGSGVHELRRDLSKLLRDARRHAGKLGSTTRKDLERLQKDLAAAAKRKPARTISVPKATKPARAAKVAKPRRAARPKSAAR